MNLLVTFHGMLGNRNDSFRKPCVAMRHLLLTPFLHQTLMIDTGVWYGLHRAQLIGVTHLVALPVNNKPVADRHPHLLSLVTLGTQ